MSQWFDKLKDTEVVYHLLSYFNGVTELLLLETI